MKNQELITFVKQNAEKLNIYSSNPNEVILKMLLLTFAGLVEQEKSREEIFIAIGEICHEVTRGILERRYHQ